MGGDAISIEILGLEETQRAMEQIVRDLSGPPMVNAMREATLLVTRDAKQLVPVDTGRLWASITPQVVFGLGIGGVQGVVGSNVSYAPYVELGTRPHFVPAKYIGVWASRHGFGVTGLRVSGKAHEFLKRAFLNNKDRIFRTISAAVNKIVRGKG